MISHIFLDTNVLDSAWPKFSEKIENILRLGRKLEVNVEIPQPVVVELRRRWRNKMKSVLDQTQTNCRKLEVFIGGQKYGANLPSLNELVEAYQGHEIGLLKSWGIATTSFPAINLCELFDEAAERQGVFGDKGINFQDSVILHAVIEQMAGREGIGVLVSDDVIVQERKLEIDRLATLKLAKCECLKLKDVESRLVGLLAEKDQKRYLDHKEMATKAVHEFLPRFEGWFAEQINSPFSSEVFGETTPRIVNATFDEVVDVDVPQLQADPAPGASIMLSAIVRATADVEQKYVNMLGQELTMMINKRQEVGFTAHATFDGSQYTIKSIVSATFGTPGPIGTIRHGKLL